MVLLYGLPGVMVLITLIIIPLWAFRKGIEIGTSISKGATSIPPLVRTPKIVQDFIHRKQTKQNEEFNRAFNNVMSYAGEPQKEGEDN